MTTPQDLIALCKRGDSYAYTRLYDLHAKYVYNAICRYIDHTGEAEDILQETFVDVYHSIGKLTNAESFRPWTKRIAINKAINAFRKRKLEFTELEPDTVFALAQTVINRTYPVKAGQHLLLKFVHPVMRISTWDKNEVSVTAKVSINDGDNDDAFVLKEETIDGTLQISDQIKDMDKLPHHYTVWQEGKKTVFKTKADFEAYRSKAGSIRSYSNGIDLDIKLEIKVPANTPTDIKATYGMVELVNFHAPVNVDAIYGGIDATVDKARAGQIKATTSYGRIYSNLDLELTDKTQKDF